MKYAKAMIFGFPVLFFAVQAYHFYQSIRSGVQSEAEIMRDLQACIAELPRFDHTKAAVSQWSRDTGLAPEDAPYDYAELLKHEAMLCGDWFTRRRKSECAMLKDRGAWMACTKEMMVPLLAKLSDVIEPLRDVPEFMTADYVRASSYRNCRTPLPRGSTLEDEAVLDLRCQVDMAHTALGQASLVRYISAPK